MELDDVAHLWWSNSHAELTEISSRATVFYNSRWGLAFLCDVTEKRPPTLTLLVFQSLPPGEVRHSVFWLWQRLPNQRLFQDLASPSLKTCFSFLQLSQWSLTTFSSETLRCLLHQATFSPEELCTGRLYTRVFLHQNSVYIRKFFVHHTPGDFTPIRLLHQKPQYKTNGLREVTFTPENQLHQNPFTANNFFTPKPLYTKHLFTSENYDTKNLLHQNLLYKKNL